MVWFDTTSIWSFCESFIKMTCFDCFREDLVLVWYGLRHHPSDLFWLFKRRFNVALVRDNIHLTCFDYFREDLVLVWIKLLMSNISMSNLYVQFVCPILYVWFYMSSFCMFSFVCLVLYVHFWKSNFVCSVFTCPFLYVQFCVSDFVCPILYVQFCMFEFCMLVFASPIL